MPYAQSTLEFHAYVTQGKDVLNRIDPDGTVHWKQLSVNFIAMEPERI